MIPPVQQSFPKNHPTLPLLRDAQPWDSGFVCSECFSFSLSNVHMMRDSLSIIDKFVETLEGQSLLGASRITLIKVNKHRNNQSPMNHKIFGWARFKIKNKEVHILIFTRCLSVTIYIIERLLIWVKFGEMVIRRR